MRQRKQSHFQWLHNIPACYPVACLTVLVGFLSKPLNCLDPESVYSKRQLYLASKELDANEITEFWEDVRGEEHVSKLNSADFESFTSNHSDTFIMFYANWCKYSQEAKEEFATAAEEIAYTEGFKNVRFGALDCNATLPNKRICNKTFNVTKYPRFLYFKSGKVDRMFPVNCPRYTEEFYNWIVHKGDSQFCLRYRTLAMSASTASSQLHATSWVQMYCIFATFFRLLLL